MATFELAIIQRKAKKRTPEMDISNMVKAIREFDDFELKHWKRCKVRTFSLGTECGPKPFAFMCLLSPKLVRAIAEVNAGIEIVIFQPLAADASV